MPTFAVRTVKIADVAQLAEHLICNQAAVGSSPSIGSGSKGRRTEQRRTIDLGSYQSGQMGQTVNLLAYAFGGSNPSLPTIKKECRLELQNPGRQTEAPLRGGGVFRRQSLSEGGLQERGLSGKAALVSSERGSADSDAVCFCGSSSVDRASAFQAEGREFEPRLPLYAGAGR